VGRRERRPALDQLLADARRRRFDVVVCWRLDRLGRNLKHLITLLDELQALGIQFVSLAEGLDATTPAREAPDAPVGAIAEFERDRIRERVLAGLQRARTQGKRARPNEGSGAARTAPDGRWAVRRPRSRPARRIPIHPEAVATAGPRIPSAQYHLSPRIGGRSGSLVRGSGITRFVSRPVLSVKPRGLDCREPEIPRWVDAGLHLHYPLSTCTREAHRDWMPDSTSAKALR
jgi:hypothetical protein